MLKEVMMMVIRLDVCWMMKGIRDFRFRRIIRGCFFILLIIDVFWWFWILLDGVNFLGLN